MRIFSTQPIYSFQAPIQMNFNAAEKSMQSLPLVEQQFVRRFYKQLSLFIKHSPFYRVKIPYESLKIAVELILFIEFVIKARAFFETFLLFNIQ